MNKDGHLEVDTRRRILNHQQRAQLMIELVKKYDVKVEKNNEWDKMNSDEPREWVEIILAIINAGVLTAIISTFQTAIKNKGLKRVEIELPDRSISVAGITKEELEDIMWKSGFSKHSIDASTDNKGVGMNKSSWRRILFWKK
jgi:hypothetical protein